MKINLTRAVDLSAFQVVLDIGRAEERKDILAILMKAKELGGRITSEDVCKYLLIDRPIALGRTVIARCRDLNLIDLEGRLTPLGEDALAHGRIFPPEHGRYRILCTQDPLLPQGLVRLEEVREPSAHDVVQKRKQAKAAGKAAPVPDEAPVPEWIRCLKDRTLTLLDSGKEIRVLDVALRGAKDSVRAEEKLTLHWTLPPDDDPALEVKGFARRTLEPPPVAHEEVFLALLGDQRGDWIPETGAFRVTFAATNESERSSHRRDLRVEQPSLHGYGTFEGTEVRDIPLIPRALSDAQQWADWTLDRSLTGYLTPSDYRALLNRVASGFPGFSLRFPKQEEKATALRKSTEGTAERPSPAYWFLQAPLDLEMPEASP